MKKLYFKRAKVKKVKKKRNHKKYTKLKYLILFIFIILIIIKNIFSKQSTTEKLNLIVEKYNPELITYNGEKVQKKKLIEDYLSRVSENDKAKTEEIELINKYFYLDEYVNDPKIKLNIKNKLMEMFSKMKGKQTDKIDTIFIRQNNRFGNSVITVNNAIFYCEAIGCNKVILNEHNLNRQWLFKDPVYIKEINITVMLGENLNCDDNNIICLQGGKWDPFYVEIAKPEIRMQYLRDELLRNLPNVNTEPDDLYIHLRGEDAFRQNPLNMYAQPPLCFYEKIINNNKFKKIYIVAMDRKNIIFDALIKKYKDIIYNEHSYEYDLSLLIHAYNFAISVSTFSISAVKFNNNLRNLWEYDIFRFSGKFLSLHHQFFKFDIKFKIHTMKPSDIYADKMFNWKYSESQLKLMLEDNCPNDFVTKGPNK